jgi:hypothetical protein
LLTSNPGQGLATLVLHGRLVDDLIVIRVLPPGLFPQDRACHLRERLTAGDRWRPLRTARIRWRVDQTWTRHSRSRGQRRSASRTLPGKETPAGCPRQASPARAIALLGGALAGSGPGTSPYIDGLSAASGMVIPQRCTCSNRTEDGGWLADVAVPDLFLIRHIRGMRSCCWSEGRTAHQGRQVDRGCPLDTVIVCPMWHASGTPARTTFVEAWWRWSLAPQPGEAVQEGSCSEAGAGQCHRLAAPRAARAARL